MYTVKLIDIIIHVLKQKQTYETSNPSSRTKNDPTF